MAKEATFSIGFVRDILRYAASKGADLDKLCAAAGISTTMLNLPDSLVSGAVVQRAWQVAIEESEDSDLGLHLGEVVHPSYLGLLGFAMLSCETLGDAIERLMRYWKLLSNATTICLHRRQTLAVLEMSVVNIPGNYTLQEPRQPLEVSFSSMLAIARSLTGRDLPLTEVAFTYPAPARTREHERIFSKRPRYLAEANILSFKSEALHWPVLQANPELLAMFDQQIAERLTADPESLVDKVRHEFSRRLGADVPDLPSVARNLNMSNRALQRDLRASGTSFREILDGFRKDLALHYLKNKSTSIAELSFFLGFSEPSVFHRSFRKWTGITPQAFRRA
jgi:AraC-like DNA-binding protein